MNADFCQGDIEEPRNKEKVTYHPLLKTHSNKEHENANIHPPNPESIEKIVGKTIHSVPVLILYDWECVLHVYIFLDELLEEILDLHLLFIFLW